MNHADCLTMRPEDHKAGTGHLPGESGIWMFIAGDMVIFSLFFVVFTHGLGQNPELFRESQALLNETFGALNTVLLLCSSWLVATAVAVAREGRNRLSRQLLAIAMLCGSGFTLVKFFEWREKLNAGIGLQTNEFFTYYFVFCGIHLLHVLIGIGVLAFMIRRLRGNTNSAETIVVLESGATFWHVVDLLWIGLFALLYLLH